MESFGERLIRCIATFPTSRHQSKRLLQRCIATGLTGSFNVLVSYCPVLFVTAIDLANE